MGCPCEIATKLMVALGAFSAANMHRPGAELDYSDIAGWQRHIDEEERLLFPLTARVDAEATRQLQLDHQIFLAELQGSGEIVSLERLRQHSALEDKLALEVVERGLVDIGQKPGQQAENSFRWSFLR